MNTFRLISKSDIIGSTASFLCLVHCLVTPLLFVAQAEILGHGEAHPMWWGLLDVFFLVISYFAVWWSGQTTTKSWIRYALWISWIVLTVIVLNEKLAVVPLPESAIYMPALSLIVLHLYNRKYCNHCIEQ
ncbi:MAG: MerC domain-containing protein [Bacteroidota bacterium]